MMGRALILLTTLIALLAPACSSEGDGAEDAAATTSAEPSTTDRAGDGSGPDASGATGGAGGPIDVCSLLSGEEVAVVLGEPARPTDQSTGSMYACSWEGTDNALNALSVSVYVHPDAATAKDMYDQTKEGLEGSDIMGLGDEASYAEAFGLEVLSGRYDISVDNTGPNEKASDLAVAKRVIAQLP